MVDRTLTLPEFLEKHGASVRLQNVVREFWRLNHNPYKTVAEFLEAGDKALHAILVMPNAGKKTLAELKALLRQDSNVPDIGPRDVATSKKEKFVEDSFPPLNDKPGVVVEHVFRLLDEVQRDVIQKRFGLRGATRKTLEEVGVERGVTRERVRQIESKSLKRISARVGQEVQLYLSANSERLWEQVAGNTAVLLLADYPSVVRRRLSSEDFFLIYVAYKELRLWLSSIANPLKNGWLSKDYDAKHILALGRTLHDRAVNRTLPDPVESYARALECTRSQLETAIAIGNEFQVYRGYLVPRSLPRRMRRTVRLHHLWTIGGTPVPKAIRDIRREHVDRHPDDPCSIRDIHIVMTDASHLFLNMYEEGWTAIGPMSYVPEPEEKATVVVPLVANDSDESGVKDDNPTIAASLRRILQNQGPMIFDDLRETFVKKHGARYSKASVGPVLIMHDEFVRFAPGIYGLRAQLDLPSAIEQATKALLSPRHCEIYCQSRWAGQPLDLYPMWTPRMEHTWASWARLERHEELLRSLLSVCNLAKWPVGVLERERWVKRKETLAYYSLENDNNIPLTDTLPTLADIVRAALYARYVGHISWISTNRIRGLRIDDRHSHTVLAILIALNLVEATAHWQEPHKYRPDSDLVDALAMELYDTDSMEWSPRAYEVLTERFSKQTDLGWLEREKLTEVIDAIGLKAQDAMAVLGNFENPQLTHRKSKLDLDSLVKTIRAQRLVGETGGS